ncbi:hypothetical protein D3C73_1437460 [compost metagenome]
MLEGTKDLLPYFLQEAEKCHFVLWLAAYRNGIHEHADHALNLSKRASGCNGTNYQIFFTAPTRKSNH